MRVYPPDTATGLDTGSKADTTAVAEGTSALSDLEADRSHKRLKRAKECEFQSADSQATLILGEDPPGTPSYAPSDDPAGMPVPARGSKQKGDQGEVEQKKKKAPASKEEDGDGEDEQKKKAPASKEKDGHSEDEPKKKAKKDKFREKREKKAQEKAAQKAKDAEREDNAKSKAKRAHVAFSEEDGEWSDFCPPRNINFDEADDSMKIDSDAPEDLEAIAADLLQPDAMEDTLDYETPCEKDEKACNVKQQMREELKERERKEAQGLKTEAMLKEHVAKELEKKEKEPKIQNEIKAKEIKAKEGMGKDEHTKGKGGKVDKRPVATEHVATELEKKEKEPKIQNEIKAKEIKAKEDMGKDEHTKGTSDKDDKRPVATPQVAPTHPAPCPELHRAVSTYDAVADVLNRTNTKDLPSPQASVNKSPDGPQSANQEETMESDGEVQNPHQDLEDVPTETRLAMVVAKNPRKKRSQEQLAIHRKKQSFYRTLSSTGPMCTQKIAQDNCVAFVFGHA